MREIEKYWKEYTKDAQSGQILMVVILVMVVALTVTLSVATRSISNYKTSTQEQSSGQAFSAAEAGIEQSLSKKNNVSGSFTNNTTYQTTISDLAGTSFLLNNGDPVIKDDGADVWLSTYPTYNTPWSGNLTVYWGQSSDNCQNIEANNTMAALEIVLLTGTKNTPVISHYLLDPCQLRSASNSFDNSLSGGGTISGKTFVYSKTIPVVSGLIARIIPLYSPTYIGVTGDIPLPSQGKVVQSVGTAADTQRKIVTFQSYPRLPAELFSFTIFSPK